MEVPRYAVIGCENREGTDAYCGRYCRELVGGLLPPALLATLQPLLTQSSVVIGIFGGSTVWRCNGLQASVPYVNSVPVESCMCCTH